MLVYFNVSEAKQEEEKRKQVSANITSLPDFRDGSVAESKREGSLEQMQETPIDEGDTAGAYFSIFMYYVQVYSEFYPWGTCFFFQQLSPEVCGLTCPHNSC